MPPSPTRRLGIPASCLLALTFSGTVEGATYYVGPTGSGQECSRSNPCALATGAEVAEAGDTVVLMDGTYHEPLHPQNSGRSDAWITFRADECALPILEGPGEGILEDAPGEAPSGVASSTGTYLRFVGIVSRHWDSGFTNGWTGEDTTNSNGHFEYINCIGDGNGRTGMVLYSAPGITIRESISAHNGGNPMGSWSSGIQLYAVQGTADDNLVERNVSFENTDAERNSDGSGFIVDEHTQGATFINNLAFRNGGSCMRLTRSINTRMINFSCYHNGMNPNATGPTNPGEFYFTDSESRDSAIVINALAAASGTEMDPQVFMFPPTSGLANNVVVDSGATPFFSDPEGGNPDFRPPASAAGQVENLGSQSFAPNVDLGFDPKCIVRRDPEVPFQQSWWEYAIDYDYIRSIGGVKACFHPKARSGGVDVGAYEVSGDPHAFSEPGSCVPPPVEEDPVAAGGAGPVAMGGNGGSAGGGSDLPVAGAGQGGGMGGVPVDADPEPSPNPFVDGTVPDDDLLPEPSASGPAGTSPPPVDGTPTAPNPVAMEPSPGAVSPDSPGPASGGAGSGSAGTASSEQTEPPMAAVPADGCGCRLGRRSSVASGFLTAFALIVSASMLVARRRRG